MEIYDEFITPVELTGMIRQALFDLNTNQFQLSSVLPNVTIPDITASFLTGQQGLAEASVYRAFNAETPIGRRESLSRANFNLAPLGEKIPLDEYHSMRLRNIDSDMAATLEPFIGRDVVRLARNIGARFEIARGDALFNGRVTINENGVSQVLDFGRAAEASEVVLGTTAGFGPLWTNHDTSTPVNDLQKLVQRFRILNGVNPEAIWIPQDVYTHVMQSAQVRVQVFGNYVPAGASTPLVSNAQAEAALSAFGLPPFRIYDATTKVVNSVGVGVVTRITPADKILLVAPGETLPGEGTSLGATFLGQTAEASLSEYGLAPADQPGIVAANWYSKDPVTYWTHAAALGIPVLRDPNLSYVAKVV